MIQKHLKILNKYSFLLMSLIFFVTSQAQNEDAVIQIDTQAVSVIPVNYILEEGEKINLRIIKLKKILEPNATINKLDSIFEKDSIEIYTKRDSLLSQLENITARSLKIHKVEWVQHHTYLKEYQNEINNRTEEINNIENELTNELQRWNLTRNIFDSSEDSNDIHDVLNKIIAELEENTQIVQTRLDQLFVIQKKIIGLVLTVDKTLFKIEEVELQMQKNYFAFDTNPIWKSKNVEIVENDSINSNSISTIRLISTKLKENKSQLKEFLSINIKALIFQLLFIIFLIIVIIRTKIKWKNNLDELTNPIEKQAKIILSHPFLSAGVLGLVISNLFYQALIPVFGELIVLALLIFTIILLPKLTNKHFRVVLLLIFASYFIYLLETFLSSKLVLSRVLIIVENIVIIFAFVIGRRIIKKFPEQFNTIYKLFNIIARFYIIILCVAILANIIGMMNLSRFLSKGIITSTILGMVVFLAIKTIASLIVMFFKLHRTHNIKTLSTIFSVTNRRILPILNWVGVIIWLMFALKGFGVFDLIVTWISELMHEEWKIGEAIISFGGILSFLFILIITLVITKIMTSFFQDDWLINKFPRGVAATISLMLKIVLLSIGFGFGLSAAGFDISKLGFIIGALGVGIGFGLQNVVLNFIAGLILSFERPINLGDAIEADQEMGVVTHIGVRASTIKSYKGYDVIVPNGDLITKKLINYTLSNSDRRSKILMRTAANADPEKVMSLFNKIASEHPNTFSDPAPKTYFYGYGEDGNLNFALLYWSTFSDTLNLDHEISLDIFKSLKKEGIEAPVQNIKIIKGD